MDKVQEYLEDMCLSDDDKNYSENDINDCCSNFDENLKTLPKKQLIKENFQEIDEINLEIDERENIPKEDSDKENKLLEYFYDEFYERNLLNKGYDINLLTNFAGNLKRWKTESIDYTFIHHINEFPEIIKIRNDTIEFLTLMYNQQNEYNSIINMKKLTELAFTIINDIKTSCMVKEAEIELESMEI